MRTHRVGHWQELGLLTSSGPGQSSVRIFLANKITSELNSRIQRLLASGLYLYGILRPSTVSPMRILYDFDETGFMMGIIFA